MKNTNFSVFISSVGSLKSYRDAAEKALKTLDTHGSRYENWSSSPDKPLDECFKKIDESDAVILLLGGEYGSLHESGFSITHLEYRHAHKKKIPIFCYIIKSSSRDPKQENFIREIEKEYFHCKEIENEQKLCINIRNSLLEKFKQCFKAHYKEPSEIPSSSSDRPTEKIISNMTLPLTPNKVYELLEKLYQEKKDQNIYRFKDLILKQHKNNANIMMCYYAAVINLGMSNITSINRNELLNAIEFLKKNMSISKKNSYSWNYNIGNAYTALKKYELAIEYYGLSIKEKPDNAECLKNLGTAYYKIADTDNAEKCFLEALNYNPLLFEALYSISTLLINKRSQFTEAIQYLDRIVLSGLSSEVISSVYFWKSKAYAQMGDIDNAIANAENAMFYDAESEWGCGLLANLYSRARHLDQKYLESAYTFFKKYIMKKPASSEACAELGFICWFLRDKRDYDKLSTESLACFLKAMELNYEDDGLVWDKIGHLYQDTNNWIAAEESFRKAALINKKHFGYCLAIALSHLGKYEEAINYLEDSAKNYQQDELSWHNLAYCYEKLKKFEEAEKAYLKSIEINKEYALSWFNLGGLYWNNHMAAKARKTWTKAIELFPEHELTKEVKNVLEKF